MILSLRGHFCNLFTLSLLAACGAGAPPFAAADSAAATIACPSQCGLSCQSGCYPTSVATDGACGSPNGNVRVQCARIQGSPILTCEAGGCPSGYYADATASSTLCSSGLGGIQTECRTISGAQLQTCEEKCPSGYYPSSARTNVQACALRYAPGVCRSSARTTLCNLPC